MDTLRSIFIKSYKRLLYLYPHSYREEFAEQMFLDFSDMAADAGQKGIGGFVFFLLHELVDFPVNLLKAYLSEAAMTPNFRPGAASTILRIAFVFGLTLATNSLVGILAFASKTYFPAIWRIAHFFGWRATFQDIQSMLSSVSNFVLGPVLAAVILLVVFPQLRPLKRYLPASALVFAFPAALVELRLILLQSLNFGLSDTVFAIAYIALVGLQFGILASLIARDPPKTFWLLFAGPLVCLLTIWVSNLLLYWSLQRGYPVTLLGSVASIATRNALIGMTIGLLLGIVLEFKRRDQSPDHFSPTSE